MPPTTRGASERLLRPNELAEHRPGRRLFGERPACSRRSTTAGRSASMPRGGSPISLRPTAAAVAPLKAIARRSRKSCSRCSMRLCSASRIAWSRLPRAAGRGDHVPQADAAASASRSSRCVITEAVQLLADRAAEQPPELVGRMRIITPRGERRVAGQAAEHEQPRVGPGDRRQSDFDAHAITPTARAVQASDLRVALFSGNYNYVRDGANQALNRLVGYLLRQGVQGPRLFADGGRIRRFRATGDLVDVPAIPIPGRSEYRLPLALPARVRRDLAEFNPNVVHVSSPDIVGHRAVTWARQQQDRGRRLGPHALRHLSRLLSFAGARAARARDHAPLLSPLRSRAGARRNRPRRSSARSA